MVTSMQFLSRVHYAIRVWVDSYILLYFIVAKITWHLLPYALRNLKIKQPSTETLERLQEHPTTSKRV
jgi:hypothetical protein